MRPERGALARSTLVAMTLILLGVPMAPTAAHTRESDVALVLRVDGGEAADGPRIAGDVRNDSAVRIGRVQLRVAGPASPDRESRETWAWGHGTLPGGGGGSSGVRVPPLPDVAGAGIEFAKLIARERTTEAP
jgi:hypothetical protein